MSESVEIPNNLLSPADVARYLRVSVRTVFVLRKSGFAGRPPLKPVMTGNKMVRFDPDDVRAWLRSSTETTERRGRGRPRKYPVQK